MAKAKKYTVAPGVCFTHEGKDYLFGDEITKDIFKPESDFNDYVKKDMIIEMKEEASKEDETSNEDTKAEEEVKEEAEKKASEGADKE